MGRILCWPAMSFTLTSSMSGTYDWLLAGRWCDSHFCDCITLCESVSWLEAGEASAGFEEVSYHVGKVCERTILQETAGAFLGAENIPGWQPAGKRDLSLRARRNWILPTITLSLKNNVTWPTPWLYPLNHAWTTEAVR